MKKARFGSLSLEDLQEDQLAGEEESSDNVEVLEIFEPEQIEGDSASDADVIEDAISEVEEVGEGLESLHEALSVSLADGGMNAQSAMFASLAYGNLTGKWVASDSRMPGMESFESAGGRLQATTYAMESIGETLKAWWEKLKAMVNKWIDAVLAFYTKHVAQSGRLAKAAKALAKKAREHTGSAKESTVKLDASEIQNLTLSHSEKVSDNGIISGLTKLFSDVKKVGDNDKIAAGVKNFANELDKIKFDNEKVEELQKGLNITISEVESDVKSSIPDLSESHKDYVSTEFVKYLVSKPLLGNRIVVVKIVGDKDGKLDGLSIGLVATDKKAKFESGDAPALSSGEISKLAEEVAKVATAVADYKAEANKRRQIFNQVKDCYDKAVKGLDKTDWAKNNKEAHRLVKGKLSGFSSMAMAIMQPMTDLQKQTMASSRAAYNYALKSYKNLESK